MRSTSPRTSAANSLSSVRGGRGSRCGGDDAGRREADAQKAALALGDHLEPHRGLVDARPQLLELAQRGPLGLADGLAGRLDLQRLAHRLAFPFLRLTRRGCCGAEDWAAGVDPPSAGSGAAAGATSFGGVRDERRSGGAGRGIRRRVISP